MTRAPSCSAAAREKSPGLSGASRPPRSALTTCARSAWRSLSVPACSSATRRVRWSNTSSDSGATYTACGRPGELGAVRRQPLEEPHHVVAGRADEPAVERNAVDLRLEQSARGRARRASARATRRAFVGRGSACRSIVSRSGCSSTRQRLAEADERVAREALAALDALEQKARLERP